MRVANYWEGKHYAFFCNKECEFFPCHQTKHPEKFNCLFCYCPLYALGDKCGGNITGKYQEIMEIVKQNADLKEEK